MRNFLILALVMGSGLDVTKVGAAGDNGASDLVARIHFVGSTRLLGDANAGKLKEIAALPESHVLREQTVLKLATAPFRLLKDKVANRFTDYAVQMRPMVEDLLDSESYVEIRGATNPVPDLVLAVHLDAKKSAYWRTNLATILASWTALKVTDIETNGFKGWELKKHLWPNVIRFYQANDWVVFGWGQNDLPAQTALLRRIRESGRPVNGASDYMLNAWVDWPAIASRLPELPFKLPITQLIVQTKRDVARPEGYLRSEMAMKFPEPLGMTLDPWKIPTNIVHSDTNDLLISFTAYRGVRPWLNRFQLIKDLGAEPLPNQLFVWAMSQVPFETSFAVAVPGATNYLKRVQSTMIPALNADMAGFNVKSEAQWTTNNEIVVTGNPFVGPHLSAVGEAGGDFLVGGVFPKLPHEGPMPPELVGQILSRTNLVCYDWEITEARVTQWRALSQLSLILAGKPITTVDTPAQKWIDAIKKKLGNCGTIVTLTGPDEMTAVRNSPMGLSSFEITWLAYWLDAQGFPWDAIYYDDAQSGKAP